MIGFCPMIQWDIFICSVSFSISTFLNYPGPLGQLSFLNVMVKLNTVKYKINFDLQLCSAAYIALIPLVNANDVKLNILSTDLFQHRILRILCTTIAGF